MILTVNKDYDFSQIGEEVELKAGDIIVHKGIDHATIYNYLIKPYPNVRQIPIAPGTELFTKHGADSSYIFSV